MLTWDEFEELKSGSLSQYEIIRRNGAVVPFDLEKIAIAMMKAFVAIRDTCKAICNLALVSGDLLSPLFSTTAIFKRGVLATVSSIEQQLFALSKFAGVTINLQPGKASGFFSASKANLRNAP